MLWRGTATFMFEEANDQSDFIIAAGTCECTIEVRFDESRVGNERIPCFGYGFALKQGLYIESRKYLD